MGGRVFLRVCAVGAIVLATFLAGCAQSEQVQEDDDRLPVVTVDAGRFAMDGVSHPFVIELPKVSSVALQVELVLHEDSGTWVPGGSLLLLHPEDWDAGASVTTCKTIQPVAAQHGPGVGVVSLPAGRYVVAKTGLADAGLTINDGATMAKPDGPGYGRAGYVAGESPFGIVGFFEMYTDWPTLQALAVHAEPFDIEVMSSTRMEVTDPEACADRDDAGANIPRTAALVQWATVDLEAEFEATALPSPDSSWALASSLSWDILAAGDGPGSAPRDGTAGRPSAPRAEAAGSWRCGVEAQEALCGTIRAAQATRG